MGEEEKRACSPVLQMPVNAYKCVYVYIFPFSFHCYLTLEEKTVLPHKQWMSRSRMERNKGPYPPHFVSKRERKKRHACYPVVDTDSGGGKKTGSVLLCSALRLFVCLFGKRTDGERKKDSRRRLSPFFPSFSFVLFFRGTDSLCLCAGGVVLPPLPPQLPGDTVAFLLFLFQWRVLPPSRRP